MPRINQKTWREVKIAYQKGEGSCRELAIRFKLNFHTLCSRCKREGWNQEKDYINQNVTQEVVKTITCDATQWVKDTIKRGETYRKEIDQSKEQAAAPGIDPFMLDALSKVEVRVTDMVRKAFGLPDITSSSHHTGVVEHKHVYTEQEQEQFEADFRKLRELIPEMKGEAHDR